MYILGIAETFNDFIKNVKDFFNDNYNNPLLWLGIVLGVLVIFGVAYTSLHGRD